MSAPVLQNMPGVPSRCASFALLACAGFATQGSEVTRYVHTDALGSPVAESDEAGVIVARYEYEPYGAAIGEGPKDGPAYTGHVADSATGLTYMQQRYYDPELGAFVSVDPVSAYSSPLEQFNRYRYANDDPYGFTDPDGRRAQEGAGRRNDPASMGARSFMVSAQMATSASANGGGRMPAPSGVSGSSVN